MFPTELGGARWQLSITADCASRCYEDCRRTTEPLDEDVFADAEWMRGERGLKISAAASLMVRSESDIHGNRCLLSIGFQLAALGIENGVAICSSDADFSNSRAWSG
ncbi:MAG TPA: hypothetical protein DEG43_08305 [Acidimicrobiaceae bacterium]|jgi:hypothetical protein|nr:hypothetical protein [Acidimicrobiaceae bacterium]